LFFCYFAIVPKSDFFQVFQIVWPNVADTPNLFQLISGLGFKDSHFLGLVFSILQTTLAINCGLIYQFGINETLRHKIKYKPYLIGVGGDSGSGKSTFTKHIADLFGPKNVSVIRGDDMHRWERGDEQWQHITHLNPKANHLHHDLQHAKSLKAGRTVDRRQYDHADGKFTLPVAVKAIRVIINEGLHPFYLSHTRKLFDCKIFINPEESLRQHWKIVRDMAKRGYSKTQIVDQILARAKDAERYILVQGRYADIIVSYQLKEDLKALGNPDESYELVLSCQLDNNVNLDPLLLALGGIETLLVVQNYINEDSQTIVFDGTVQAQKLEIILADLVPELQEITIQPAQLADNYNGLLQLLVAYYVFNKLEME
jgi:uridine kinase